MANTTQDIENLAAQIGDNIYIDVSKWHLYLREAHLHSVVAEKVFPLLENDSLSENAVMSILREIKVTLSGFVTQQMSDRFNRFARRIPKKSLKFPNTMPDNWQTRTNRLK